MNHERRTIVWTVVTNVAALALSWLAFFSAVQGAARFGGGWLAMAIAGSFACILGAMIALGMRARAAVYLAAAMLASTVSELVIHAFCGIRAAQGAPTHFAVLGAAVLGVLFGGVARSHGGHRGPDLV